MRNLPLAELVAVCDSVPLRAQELARRQRIPAVHSSLDEMLSAARPDVVHVLTPPDTHVELAARCLRSGSHVMVEKPLGVTVEECRRLQDIAVATGRCVGVNHNRVFIPAFRDLVELIRGCRVGRVNHTAVFFSLPATSLPSRDPAQFMFQHPRNMVFDVGSHPFSMVHRLMGRLVQVRATVGGLTEVSAGRSFYHTWQASMVCERGTAQMVLSVGRGVREVSVVVLGEDAVARADLERGSMMVYGHSPYKIYGGLVQCLGNAAGSIRGALRPLMDRGLKLARGATPPGASAFFPGFCAFYEALADGRCPPAGLDEGLGVVEYCERTAAAALGS